MRNYFSLTTFFSVLLILRDSINMHNSSVSYYLYCSIYSFYLKGAFWGLMLSLIVGIVRMALDFTYTAPICGSGESDSRPAIVREIDFLHFAAILAVFSAIAMAVISALTKPRPDRKVS